MFLDCRTWSAVPWADVDADGVQDLFVRVEASTVAGQSQFVDCVLSSRDLRVLRCAPDLQADELTFAEEDSAIELTSQVKEGGQGAWTNRGDIDIEPQPTENRDPVSQRVVPTCGDLDGDGAIDWLVVVDEPARVRIHSGSNYRLLREIPIPTTQFATAATGAADLGDVDADGAVDRLVVGHVSRSSDRLAPRTCEIGLLAIVSGVDGRVIRALDREALLAMDPVRRVIEAR
jgi:hypothetical protein